MGASGKTARAFPQRSGDDNGHLFRAQTTLVNSPNWSADTAIVISDNEYDLFEASTVYQVPGRDQHPHRSSHADEVAVSTP